MSELILVRHGQASFGSDSYDKLSETGHRQVGILSEHLQGLGERFDAMYSGELRRQKETAVALRPLLEPNPDGWHVNAAFNEYESDPLISSYLREHGKSEGFEITSAEQLKDRRLFQKIFEAATARWIADQLTPTADDTGFEPWRDFQSRVHGAIDELMQAHGSGSRVLISTSGGVIALALQRVLNLPDNQTIATNWMVNNSSITRIRYGGGRASLSQFNALTHLENTQYRALITYR